MPDRAGRASSSVPTRRTNSRKRSHSGDGARPAPMPVLRMTSRATRSGCSTARRRPIGPPQSWTTTVAPRRSSSSDEPLDRLVVEVVGVVLEACGLVGAAEAEVVGRDDAGDRGEGRDHLPVEERPARLAVEQEDRVALAFLDVVHAETVLLQVARREVVAAAAPRTARRACGRRPRADHDAPEAGSGW